MNLQPHYSYSFYINKQVVYLLIKKHQTEKTCTTALPQHNNIKELCMHRTNNETPAQTHLEGPERLSQNDQAAKPDEDAEINVKHQ